MRCWSNSIVSCRTLPGARTSSRQAANRCVRPSSVSRALNSTKPPSVLASGRSKRATTDFANPSPRKITWVIQSVAIEPPRDGVLKRLDTASIAPASGSVALLFHLSRIIRASGTERVDVGAREDSRTGQGVANDVVPNLVVVQDVAFREHGVPERVDVGLGDIVVEANSIAVDVAEEYCTAPDLLHGDLDSIHEQVAGRDPVEVIGESLSFDSGFPAAGRASFPVREGSRATVVNMNDALRGDCRDVDRAPAVVDFTRAVVEGKCSAGEDRRIMPHVAIGGGKPFV